MRTTLLTTALVVALCSGPALSQHIGSIGSITFPDQPGGGECRPMILCPEARHNPAGFAHKICKLSDGSNGVTCPPSSVLFGSRGSVGFSAPALENNIADTFIKLRSDVLSSFGQAAGMAQRQVNDQISLENRLLKTGRTASRSSTTGTFGLNFRSSTRVQQLGQQALQQLLTVEALGEVAPAAAAPAFQLVANFGGSDAPPSATVIQGCQPQPPVVCRNPTSKFRTITGECNNLERPRQGMALTGFKRAFPDTYFDRAFLPRNESKRGGPLPSARLISERVVDIISDELHGFSLSLMQVGQLIDHDLNHALIFNANGADIECCVNGEIPAEPVHPQCLPIEIPRNDPFYSQFGERCMNLVRSLPAPQPDCIARVGTPINELTQYLDASMLYGSSEEEINGLRAFSGGELRTSAGKLQPLEDASSGSACQAAANVCFRAGDSRVNEQSGLTVIHTIFTRRHNFIARALQRQHSWDDEKLFQETRRIVGAEWQHVVYNEWLPSIIGREHAAQHNLLPLEKGFQIGYSTTVDASSSNAFATAALRFGHSLLREIYDLVNARGRVTQSVPLTSTFFNPNVVQQAFVEHARTLVKRRPQTFDVNIIKAVHEQLFVLPGGRFGLDLIALNIQRGRDHAIPTYFTVLQRCSAGIRINSFQDLESLMEKDAVARLQQLYADVADIDLFVGGLSEKRAPGAQVGPTFQCLIRMQFLDLKFGDRFFYEFAGQVGSLTDPQLQEIRKTSWARILCDTLSDGDFSEVQPLAFREVGLGANKVERNNCHSQAIPAMDLSVF